ncbi:MAG TPA: hypothetical protein VFP87_10115, partial [Chitinophagaceae bacterium]|nr:hypothetical protein [Chitinophagaceae bacterium]
MQRTILIAYFFISLNCLSQQYPFVHYTPRDGLVNNRARFVYQDSKGKLYIATYGGLSVYDGSRFTNYNANNGLAVNLVNCVVEMGEDSIWVMPNDNKIQCLVKGKLKDFHTVDNYIPLINSLIKCSDGYYYALADEGFFRLENGKFKKIVLEQPGTRAINTLLQAAEINKRLYILANPDYKSAAERLVVYDLAQQKMIAYDTTTQIINLFDLGDNEAWLTTWKGLYQVDVNADIHQSTRVKPLPDSFHIPKGLLPAVVYRDRQKNLWLSNDDGVYRISRNGQVTRFTTENGLTTNFQNYIFQDYENNMWFTSDQTGLSKLSNQQLAFYPALKAGYTATDIFIPPSSDSVWMHDVRHHKMTLVLPDGRTKEYLFPEEPLSSRGLFVSGQKKWLVAGREIYQWKALPGGRYSLTLFYRDTATQIGFTCAIPGNNGSLVAVSDNLIVVTGQTVLS